MVKMCVGIEDGKGVIVVTLVQLFGTGNKLYSQSGERGGGR